MPPDNGIGRREAPGAILSLQYVSSCCTSTRRGIVDVDYREPLTKANILAPSLLRSVYELLSTDRFGERTEWLAAIQASLASMSATISGSLILPFRDGSCSRIFAAS